MVFVPSSWLDPGAHWASRGPFSLLPLQLLAPIIAGQNVRALKFLELIDRFISREVATIQSLFTRVSGCLADPYIDICSFDLV